MKRIVCMICGCCLLISARAQTSSLFITTDKTTRLIFPFSIRHVDRGTKDVLVEQVREADNILLVKASSQNFHETSISVVTSDGSLYSFHIYYNGHPHVWLWQIPSQTGAWVNGHGHGIFDNPALILELGDHNWGVCEKLIRVDVKGDVIYYQLRRVNLSPIDYDNGLLKFCIRDKKRAGERRYRKMNRHHFTSQAIPF